jgi:hypothetical protein
LNALAADTRNFCGGTARHAENVRVIELKFGARSVGRGNAIIR